MRAIASVLLLLAIGPPLLAAIFVSRQYDRLRATCLA